MKRKSNLDEMQEMELLKIEHNGCWLAFWGLLAAMVIQSFINGTIDFRPVAGEWIVFMVLALYLGIACARKGIWDRHLKMNVKTNAVCSAAAGLALGAFNAVMIYRTHPTKPVGSVAAGIFIAGLCFFICFGVLTISMKQTRKRQAKMEEEPEDADEL